MIIILSIATWHYRDNYRQALRQQEVEKLAESRLDIINAIQRQQKQVAALDAKYTQELTDARLDNDRLRALDNDRLRADVAAGRRQLCIEGTCSVSKTATGASMGNGSAIEVSRETGSTVFDIRSGMISDQRKLQFLQEFEGAVSVTQSLNKKAPNDKGASLAMLGEISLAADYT